MTTISLPYPPSVNGLYKNAGKKRIKTEGYKAWLTAAGWELKLQRPEPVRGRYRLALTLTPPDRRARDVDNTVKAVSDLLKSMGVIEEDSLAKSVFAEWSDELPAKPGKLTVSIEPYIAPLAPETAVATLTAIDSLARAG